MGWPRHLDRATPWHRPVTFVEGRQTRMKSVRYSAPARENDCASESCMGQIDRPASSANGGVCGGRAGTSGPPRVKKTRSAARQVPLAEPSMGTTGAGQDSSATVNRSPDSDGNRNEGPAPGHDRRPLSLRGPLCADNDRDARCHPRHSGGNAQGGRPVHDVQADKGVDPVNRLLAGYGS